MSLTTDILAVYDSQLRRLIPPAVPAGHEYQLLGPLLRVTGQRRGFIESTRDLGVEGRALDRLVVEQRDYFAGRGEAVEWKTRAHDLPTDLEARLLVAGFIPEDRETVVVGETAVVGKTAALSGEPAVPEGVLLRQVTERPDLERIAAMKSEVWAADYSWVASDLCHRLASDPENLVVFVAEASGVVVSAAWLEINPGTDFAGVDSIRKWQFPCNLTGAPGSVGLNSLATCSPVLSRFSARPWLRRRASREAFLPAPQTG